MTWSTYGSYLALVVLVVLAPGPDTMVMVKNSLSGGSRGGLLAIFGIGCGNVVNGTAAALGLGAVIAHSQPVFTTLRWIGVVYLCYLGFQALRGAWRGRYGPVHTAGEKTSSGYRRWQEGFLSNITNPKVLVLYLSVLPQFLDPATSSLVDALVLADTVGVLGSLWLLLLLLFVHRMRDWLSRRAVRRSLDALTGTALVGFGAALAAEA